MDSSDETAATFVAAGVATVHEAQGRRGLVSGVRLVSGPAFAGPALTVAIPAGDNLGIHLALERAQPGSVLCVASGGRGKFGVVGELIIEAAHAAGLAGLVIDDGVRDVDRLRVPPSVAAVSVTPRGTVKRRCLSLHAPVALGGTLISSGDWVVGDSDGVCVIPAEWVAAVVAAAQSRVVKEEGIRERLRAGEPTTRVLGIHAWLEHR
jgi:4-hydroxy-4-methyl-2-oxoglutarate aldolase